MPEASNTVISPEQLQQSWAVARAHDQVAQELAQECRGHRTEIAFLRGELSKAKQELAAIAQAKAAEEAEAQAKADAEAKCEADRKQALVDYELARQRQIEAQNAYAAVKVD